MGFGAVPFASGFTLPLELSLRKADDGIRLYANPVKELEQLREQEIYSVQNQKIGGAETVTYDTQEQLVEVVASVKTDAKAGTIIVRFGDITLSYWLDKEQLDGVAVHDKDDGRMDFRVYIDRATWEAFAGHGSVYKMGGRKIAAPVGKISVSINAAKGTVESLKVFKLKSIWPENVETLAYSKNSFHAGDKATGTLPIPAQQSNGLAPEITDLSPKDVSWAQEAKLPAPGEYRSCRYLPALIHTISFLYINNTWAPARKSKRRTGDRQVLRKAVLANGLRKSGSKRGVGDRNRRIRLVGLFRCLTRLGNGRQRATGPKAPRGPTLIASSHGIRRRMSEQLWHLAATLPHQRYSVLSVMGGNWAFPFLRRCALLRRALHRHRRMRESRRCRADMRKTPPQ